MKLILMSLACAAAISCAAPPPPGMPLDKDLLPQTGDSAITKLER